MPKILIIDDDRSVCQSLKLLFRRKGYEVVCVNHPRNADAHLDSGEIDLVLLDMNFTISTTGKQGLDTLKKILDEYNKTPVILMTGWATVQLAVEGMKLGAHDFVAKPWDNLTLSNSVATALALRPLDDSTSQTPTDAFDPIVTRDPAMRELLDTARRVASTTASVLITGESGTGKELIAQAIHDASPRSEESFVPVNLGGVPESLFESELFGHKAGAFTDAKADRKGRFELAEGGTLFLDEIGDLPLANQVKLLRVLQERRYSRLGESRERKADVRLLSATSRQLDVKVLDGTFREDLLYRINLIHLEVPPLRSRPGDIAPLASYFLRRAAQNYERGELSFTPAALDWLGQRSFPGNVRQLRNLVERVAILCQNAFIDVKELELHASGRAEARGTLPVGKTLAEMEEMLVRRALSRHDNVITKAAAELGITRAALYRRLEKYGIDHAD